MNSLFVPMACATLKIRTMRKFDRHLGKAVYEALPTEPGIYRFYNEEQELIYVGKAKNLKRRLSQYRNARRCKAHAKMRKIVTEARHLDFETCASEFDALTLENQWIQKHRPKWNVAGAFYFLYPMIGVKLDGNTLYLCYTTEPGLYPEFQFHGAFRSRERTRTAFFSLTELLYSIGHPIQKKQLLKNLKAEVPPKYTYLYGFRQVPEAWVQTLAGFFEGSDFSPVGALSLLLLDKPDATRRAGETQEHLRNLRAFWRHEISPLKKARTESDHGSYPVTQKERDQLFITHRLRFAKAG